MPMVLSIIPPLFMPISISQQPGLLCMYEMCRPCRRLIKTETLEMRPGDYDLFKALEVILIQTTELRTTALFHVN